MENNDKVKRFLQEKGWDNDQIADLLAALDKRKPGDVFLSTSASAITEHVKRVICDEYCKWPEIYGENEGLLEDERCNDCILGCL